MLDGDGAHVGRRRARDAAPSPARCAITTRSCPSASARTRAPTFRSQTEYTRNLAPLLNAYGNDPRFTLLLFTLDESTYARELAPLAGHYPAVRLGPPWWFHDSIEGMTRFRQQVTETAGIYNTAGFNDDTRAFCSIPARHDLSRRVDANFLGGLVARHVIDLDDARRDGARARLRAGARDVPAMTARRDDRRRRASAAIDARAAGRFASTSGDNVAVAIRPIAAGDAVDVDGASVVARQDIPAGPQDRAVARSRSDQAGHQVRRPDRRRDAADRRRRLGSLAQSAHVALRAARLRVRAARRSAASGIPAPAAHVPGLSPRRRPRRHAQRALGAEHRRLRQPRRRAHREAGGRAVRRTDRRRPRLRASVRLQPARRRSKEHAARARRPAAPSECRRRADPRPRLREQSARRAAARSPVRVDRERIAFFNTQDVIDELEEGTGAVARLVERMRDDRRADVPGVGPRARPQVRRLRRLQRHQRQRAARPHRRSHDVARRQRAAHRSAGDVRRRAAVDESRGRASRCSTTSSSMINDFKDVLPPSRPAGLRESVAGQQGRRPHDARGEVARRDPEGRQRAGVARAALRRAGARARADAARIAGQRRRVVDGDGRERRDGAAVHDRPRNAARLSRCRRSRCRRTARSPRRSRTGSTSTPARCSTARRRWRSSRTICSR